MRIALPMCSTLPWAGQVALRLAELGHDVHVVDLLSPAHTHTGYFQAPVQLEIHPTVKSSITLHMLKTPTTSKLRFLFSARKLKAICDSCDIQVILVLSAGGFGCMTFLSSFRPYVVYTTGSDVLLANYAMRMFNSLVLKRAEGIFANGGYLAKKTEALCGRRDIQSLCMGVDTNRFAPFLKDEESVKIFAPRGFLPLYNNEYLIEGLALLPEKVQYNKVIFPSTGPDLDHVKALADKSLSPLARRKIVFCGGVSDEEMLRYNQESSIFVSLSRSDGTSISLLESLACGLFPIVSDIPQNREWIDPNLRNGILVPFDRPTVLAEALARAIEDRAMRRRAAEINRKIILERSDGKLNMAKLAEKLEWIVETYGKHRTD